MRSRNGAFPDDPDHHPGEIKSRTTLPVPAPSGPMAPGDAGHERARHPRDDLLALFVPQPPGSTGGVPVTTMVPVIPPAWCWSLKYS